MKDEQKDKWASVFDAHPDTNELFIGTNENGEELAFLTLESAKKFSANGKTVETVKRPTPAKEAPAKEKSAAKEKE